MLVPWYTCEITATGPAEDGVVYVRLRDTGGSYLNGGSKLCLR